MRPELLKLEPQNPHVLNQGYAFVHHQDVTVGYGTYMLEGRSFEEVSISDVVWDNLKQYDI